MDSPSPAATPLAWARREPPRSFAGAPAAVTRYVRGTRVALRIIWGAALVVTMAFSLTGPTLEDKVVNFAGAGLVILLAAWAVTRSIAKGSEGWLTLTQSESWRVSGVESITVRDARSSRRVHEVTLAPRAGGTPLFVYLLEAPAGLAGREVAVLPRGKRALVFGLEDEVLIALSVPQRRA